MPHDPGLRVCTWNVHGWCDVQGRLAYARVAETLRGLDCDILALQEVFDPARLARLDATLGTRHAQAPAAWGANALLARPALVDPRALALDVPGGELRSAVRAEVVACGVRVTVAATHLDAHDEAVRCLQYEHLAAALPRDAPALLLGDFNALCPQDYARPRWQAIGDARRAAGLDPPDDALLRRLDADGWYDLVRVAALGGGIAGDPHARGAPLPGALTATSRVGTRVDYVFGNAALLARFEVTSARVVESDASDHRPVVVALTPT
ncbi:MAG: endonuclease/exonuclease/phosphatase family protein [Polyangiales bacterium]